MASAIAGGFRASIALGTIVLQIACAIAIFIGAVGAILTSLLAIRLIACAVGGDSESR